MIDGLIDLIFGLKQL